MRAKLFSGVKLEILALAATLMLASGAAAQIVTKTLHGFSGHKDGKNAQGGVILDAAGNIYGTTQGGGSHGYGVVFELTPNGSGTWTEHELYSFTGGSDGSRPEASLIFDLAGNLYGTTVAGGAAGVGVVFELSPNLDSWTETVLHSFTTADGAYPWGGLIFDSEGNLYGTTSAGGKCTYVYGCGTVFELKANEDGSWTEKLLHEFAGGKDGMNPVDTLVFDLAGNLYGTTQGGAAGSSTAFELKPCTSGPWKEKVLHVFTGGKDGGVIWAGLILDSGGNLYGASQVGGTNGKGVIYELTPKADGSWTELLLHSFNGKDGWLPIGTLTFDSAGNLYGTTVVGGAIGAGVVFKLSLTSAGWKYELLHSFYGEPGAEPEAGVILDGDENIFGTSWGLDNTTYGSVFEITR